MNKNNYIVLAILVSVVALFSISTTKVSATVGGPTFISQIVYNSGDDSIYYVENNYGGKGCPPVIHSINLAKIQDIEVKTCDEVLEQFFTNYSEEEQDKYRQFIADTINSLPNLGSVSLKKNNIDVRVEFLSEHIEEGYMFWSEFLATLTQDGKEVGKINFRGCAKDQPHIFEGYMIPNSDAMAILISNKGDCFEGGYVNESLHVLRGIKYNDTNVVRNYKDASATEPNQGNMVVYGGSKDVEKPNNLQTTEKSSNTNIVLLVVAFLVGTGFGYLLGKKFSPRPLDNNPTRLK